MVKTTVSTIAAILVLAWSQANCLWAADSQPPDADIWAAAKEGDVEAIRRHVSAGTDLNAKGPSNGSTPLIVASVYGQTEAARLLAENGAELEARNNDGVTALIAASFLCRQDTLSLLLESGVDVNTTNNKTGQTALDTVAGEWNPELEGFYLFLAEILQIELDLEEIFSLRPVVAETLRKHGGTTGHKSEPENPSADVAALGLPCSYYVNGEIHVNELGSPERKPLTSGHADFKPSWSKTGDMLVFFRRLKNNPVVTNWKTAICVINVDGTGFHQLTDGTHTDFNQTWTRDGDNTPIWNRKNPETEGFFVMQSKVGGKPGQEVAITDKSYHTWAFTCLTDGRILVQSAHPEQGWGYYLMTPDPGGEPRFERIDCNLGTKGLLDRVSVSPSEKKVCFEYQTGFEYKATGRTLYVADFDAEKRTISNTKPFANEEASPSPWYAYPRWVRDETAIVYHANTTGKGKLYLYTLKDGSTKLVSTNPRADYRYPHGEATPK